MLKLPREVRTGDIIEYEGVRSIISSINYINYCKTDGYISEVSIEFIDTEGVCRNWVSDMDGGKVILCDSNLKSSKNLLSSYCDPYTGRYLIPYNSANVDVTLAILCLIENGYALTSYIDGGQKCYALYEIAEDCKNFQNVSNFKNRLKKICNTKGVTPFIKVSLDSYSNSELCQEVIDLILETSSPSYSIEGHSLALISDRQNLKFIEVLDACI